MKKNAGIMLLAIGITGIIMGLLIFCVSCGFMPNMDTPEDFDTLFAGVISGLVSFPLAIIGAVFYSGGKRQLNEQNNYTPDSNKEITEKRSNRLALASLITGVLGIISIPLMFYGLPEIFSILAIVFGIAGLKRAKRLDNIGDGSAIVGMTVGIVDFILQVVYVIVMYSTMAPILKPF